MFGGILVPGVRRIQYSVNLNLDVKAILLDNTRTNTGDVRLGLRTTLIKT